MKRLAAVLLVGVLLVLASPATGHAYTGVDGTVLDKNGNPWIYGGEVYVVGFGTIPFISGSGVAYQRSVSCGNGTIDASGNFSFGFGDDPLGVGGNCSELTQYPDLTLIVMFHAGPNGRPRTQDITFRNGFQIPENYHAGSVSTVSGPTAVSVNSMSASGLPINVPAGVAATLAVLTFGAITWRRNLKI